MPHVPGLRSPYDKVGRLVYFGRMLDKIRLHAQGKLPEDYIPNLGDSIYGMFDTRCCHFLRVTYADLQAKVFEGLTDEAILEWAEQRGGRRTDEECEVWNSFLMKRGWHDPADNVAHLKRRIAQGGLEGRGIETYFDFIDLDEGRDPFGVRKWERV